MRINYYMFPDEVDAHTRWKNGAENKQGECAKNIESCRGCEFNNGEGYFECPHFRCIASGYTVGGIKVTAAKSLLKEFGGMAWTEHCERDGGVFEVTDIQLKGNNSKFQYNHHL